MSEDALTLRKTFSTPAGTLTVRRYQPEDVIPHSAYIFDSPVEFLEGIGFDTATRPDRKQWEEGTLKRVAESQKEPPTIIVGEIDSRAVGMVFLDRRDLAIEPTPKLHFHIFDPNLRGKGVGPVLFKAALQSLSQFHGYKRFLIEPKASNAPMNALMRKLGFKHIQNYTLEPKPMVQRMIVSQYEILI